MVRLGKERECTPIFVYLKQSIRENPKEERWRRIFADELSQRHVAFIDLMSEFRTMARERMEQMFDPRWRHLSVEGNLFVGRRIHEHLIAHPQIVAKLDCGK